MLKRLALTLALAYASTLALTVAVFDRSLTSDAGFAGFKTVQHGVWCPKGTQWQQSDRRCVKQR
jgi:hypothetical protein